MTEPCTIAIFARAPVAGFAKTRLIPRLGAASAARLHATLVRHTLATALEANIGPVEVWCTDDSHPFFAAIRQPYAIVLRRQPEGDLGAKMLACFEAHAGAPCLLVGTDAPCITPEDLRTCASALTSSHAVFLPAEDGGYGLVGMREPIREIFENIRWGTDSVMADTRERLSRRNLVWAEPCTIWDIDRPVDLDRLAASGLLPEFGCSQAGD